MVMLLVRSAPGVSVMSLRLMRVVGVTVSTFAVVMSVVTVVVCSTVLSSSSMCRTGEVAEARVRVCFVVAKPDWEMVRM
jgi:hypothetical protein